jgi:hypothetical protein
VKNELTVLAEGRTEGIKHGGELNEGHGPCVVCIVLLEILAPELLVERVIGLVFSSAGYNVR